MRLSMSYMPSSLNWVRRFLSKCCQMTQIGMKISKKMERCENTSPWNNGICQKLILSEFTVTV